MKEVNIYEYFYAIEKKYFLFKLQAGGVFIWKLIRKVLLNEIEYKIGIIEKPKPIRRHINFKVAIKRLFRSSLLLFNHKEIIIFENSRKVFHHSNWIDPYTVDYVGVLTTLNISHVLLEDDSFGYESSFLKKRWYYSRLRHLLSNRFECKLALSNYYALFSYLENKFEEEIGVKVSLKNIAIMQLRKFLANRRYFSLIFSKVKPRAIVIVCAYGREGIVEAAHLHNIHVVEIQHGIVHSYHLGYIFPPLEFIPYFPDVIISFAVSWFNNVHLPKVKVIVGGHSYYNSNLSIHSCMPKTIDILVISQTVLADRILEFTAQLVDLLPSFNILYKPHPRDTILATSCLSKVRVQVSMDSDINLLLAKSKYVIGVFSTSLFESLGYGCKPLLLNMPGIEAMKDFINETSTPVFNKPCDVASFLQEVDRSNSPWINLSSDYWFSKSNPYAILTAVYGEQSIK